MTEKIAVIDTKDLTSTALAALADVSKTLLVHPKPWRDAADGLQQVMSLARGVDRTPELEQDETKLQVVVYTLVRSPDGRYMTYRRKGAEGRLTGKRSIGFGGHVHLTSPGTDKHNNKEHVRAEALRELEEELPTLSKEALDTLKHIGYMYDPNTPVGKVHLGILYEVSIQDSDISAIEQQESPECGQVQCLPFCLTDTAEYESWSVLARDVSTAYNNTVRRLMEPIRSTLLRNAGDRGVFTTPERDHSVMTMVLLQEATWNMVSQTWPALDEIMHKSRSDLYEKMYDTLEATYAMYGLAGTRGPDFTFVDACVEVGWFSLPLETRAVYLAHFAIAAMTRSWTMLHQYVLSGNDAAADYKGSDRRSGDFIRASMQNEDHSTFTAIVKSAKAAGVDRGRLISLVEAAYDES